MKKITILFAVLLTAIMVNAQTILDVPTVGTATRITLTGFTANWTAVPNATSYAINVYDGASALVTGSPKTVTGATSATLAIAAMLTPNTTYTYTVTAIGNGVDYLNSAESTPSAEFTTATSTGTYTLQYAASDAETLLTDLKGGAADIYELTTSGGAYTFNTTSGNNAVLIKNTTVRAAPGLAAKPVIKLNSTSTGNTTNIFQTVTPDLTIKFEGIEFDGVNPGSASQPMAFQATSAATNLKLYINNCYFHDFKNTAGNGTIRWDGVPTISNIVDIQGSVFDNCGGRILNSNPTSGASNINLKDNTFSNNLLISSRATIVYNNASNPGTITVDHCTFYNIITSGTDNIVRNPSGYGPMSFTNSIFVSVAQTLPSTNTTISYCYLGGFATPPTGTNTFPASPAPAFTNAATLDFSLTNKSSFISADTKIAGNTIYYSALPKLDPPVVGSATNIGTNGFTANWSTVANASGGYSVKVYEGETLANTTLASGQTSTSVAITGLITGTTYTYTVTAIGDATNFDSSNESAASTSFTTLGLSVPTVGTATDVTSSSFTANWTQVANASSYDVLTYLTTNLVSTTNVVGQASSSVSITGLEMGTTYTYKVVAVGDGVTYLNSDPSASSEIAKTLATTVSQLNPNFADGTWGTVYPSSLTLGTFPTFSAYGFDLTKAYVQTTNVNGLKGEAYTHMLRLDKSSNSGVMDLPTVASVSQLEIRASATTGRQFTLSIWNAGTSAWDLYGTYATTVDTENIFLINFPSTLTNAKFRIINISPGAYSFYKIKTHTTQPVALTAPLVGSASSIGITGFTANWTNSDANATGYKVFVYKGTSLITMVDAIGQSTQSVLVTGLQADSVYTYKVGAVGDGDNLYSNSLLSAASGTVTMLSDIGTKLMKNNVSSEIYVDGKTIYTSKNSVIEVFNLQGAKLLQSINSNSLQTNLSSGIYIVRYRSDNDSERIQKIIIQ